MAPTQIERIAAFEQRLSDHEGRCEERLAEIKATVAKTQTSVDKLGDRIFQLVLAVAGTAVLTVLGIVLRAAHLGG